MARVLLAWEIGGDYGHLMRYRSIAQEFARRGHEPILVLRELTHVDTVLANHSYPVFQAPMFGGQVTGLPPPLGFVETLTLLGFLHPVALAGVCRAWHALFDAIKPDLLAFDYAPTGLLASHGSQLPRVQVGASFGIPPPSTPLPLYRWWKPEPPGRVVDAERQVLVGANAVLRRFGQPELSRMSDLLITDAAMINATPELDQYPGRQDGEYWGNVANLGEGAPPCWPIVGNKRIFAYIKPKFRDFERLLDALRSIDAAVVIHAPGISTTLLKKHTAANIAFSAEPVRMVDVCRDCDLAICHSGAGSVDAVLRSGKPMLLLPQHLEQTMTAKRAQELGACLVVLPEAAPPDYGRLLRRLFEEPSFTAAAEAFARRHANVDWTDQLQAMVTRCEELIARKQRVATTRVRRTGEADDETSRAA